MSSTTVRLRSVVVVVALALVLAGSLLGNDGDFPFGPFRMYATAARVDGTVRTPFLVVVTADGDERQMRSDVVGLRPAELEGRYPQLRSDPSLLASVADAYEDRFDGVDVVEVRLLRRVRQLEDREVVSERVDLLASWSEADE